MFHGQLIANVSQLRSSPDIYLLCQWLPRRCKTHNTMQRSSKLNKACMPCKLQILVKRCNLPSVLWVSLARSGKVSFSGSLIRRLGALQRVLDREAGKVQGCIPSVPHACQLCLRKMMGQDIYQLSEIFQSRNQTSSSEKSVV